MRTLQRLLAGLVLAIVLSIAAAAKPKGASLTLRARFNATSYLLEAVEFLAEEEPSLAWRFLDRAADTDVIAGGAASDDDACWRNITREAADLVTPGVAKLIPLVLGSRQYAAKLQMVRQLAEQFHPRETACCFVSVDGHVAATPLRLADLLEAKVGEQKSPSAAEQLFSFDHVYNGSESGGSTPASPHHVAILYGTPGLPCFSTFHRLLKWAADGSGGKIVYAFRPLLLQTCEPYSGCARAGTGGQLLLPGWGMEAALKNTEYSAMDDKEASKQRQQLGAGDDDDDGASPFGTGEAAVVKGFRLNVLAARRPELRQELLTFRDQLLAADDDEAALKVWDLRDVGLQAAQRILGSADPLGLLAELSQNFPGIVSSLSRQAVNSSLRSAVGHNQQFLSAGANYMLLNGLAVDVNDLDYFGFLGRLRSEMRLRDALLAAPLELPPPLAQQIMALRAEAAPAGGSGGGEGPAEPRLSLGPTSTMTKHVAFLNDLEKDAKYQRFSHSISDLLNTFPGRLRPLARNAFTSVVVAEPLCAPSLELAMTIDRMWQGGYPVRFGVVFHLPAVVARLVQQRRYPFVQAGAPTWKEMDASERFGRAFATLREAFGAPSAWRLWISAGEEITGGGGVTDPTELVEAAFRSAWAAAARSPPPGARAKVAARKSAADALKMLQEGSGYAAEVGMQLTEAAAWLLAKGLVAAPSVSLPDSEAAPEDSELCEGQPLVWVNGLSSRPAGQADDDMMYKVMGEMQKMQEMIYYGKLDDSSGGGDVLAAVLALNGAVDRINPRIVGPKAAGAQVLPLSPLLRHPAHDTLRALYREGGSGAKSGARVAPATHFVVADLAGEEGRALVAEAVRFLAGLPASAAREVRVVLAVNPVQPETPPTMFELVVQGALGQLGAAADRDKVVTFLARLLADSALVFRLASNLDSNSVEEAQVAAKYAEEAGLDSRKLMSYLVKVVEEALQDNGEMKGGTQSMSYRAVQADLCRTVFKLDPGAAAVISNGRVTPVYQPGGESFELLAEDFSLLQLVTGGGVAAAVAKALQKAHTDDGPLAGVPAGLANPTSLDALSEVSMAVVAVLGSVGRVAGGGGGGGGNSQQLQQMMGMLKGKTLEVPGGPDAPFHLEAALNPLSRAAQRLSALLLLLCEALGPSMTLALNPQRDITEMPLKSYYRYALPQGLAPGSGLPGSPTAYFSRLPARRVLTLNLDSPESWLVEPAAALHDLDNLRLEDVQGEVAFAEFELDALMLTGSCVDTTSSGRMTPPRGLQLHLGTPSQPHLVDTLVMANLAYFQLKAAPGRWLLSLAPGRSRELYSLQSSSGTSLESPGGEDDEADAAGELGGDDVSTQVLISSFTGKHMVLRVRKRPGMESEDVLQAAGEEADEVADRREEVDLEDDEYADEDDKPPTKSVTSGAKASGVEVAKTRLRGGDTINVFTVASGHMYERLQKIMILSVLRNTKSKVKFWIIKNYMSPQHKEVIPALAEAFGFEYEFVTYKWPNWLHKQTDKQRVIWAYKILFLDVLFPLGVERIIFVDSDQVVRADLAELYHKDIKGAPYAYTPFCDNNKDMDEYRFWKGGFWRDHLQGKPYHISALYLVDLKRFRQVAAGDQLRVVYDQLSKDPNSLANLDQDLPNYAQHSIRIFSLPQEWLWCESWCGNATKAKSKTIDLCNNPRTKEPKLNAARRIIGPLWEELDRLQEEVTKTVQSFLEAEETGLPSAEAEVEAGHGSAPEAGQLVGWEQDDWGPPAADSGTSDSVADAPPALGDRTEF